MKIIYTIEFNKFNELKFAPDIFFQLWYSIYSIRKLWSNKNEIIIFTVEKNISQVLFISKKFSNIKVKAINSKYTIYTGAYGKTIGHSRVFLIPKMLKEYKDAILYLDPDTVANIKYKNGEEYIQTINKPVGAFFERSFIDYYSGKHISNLIPNFFEKYRVDSNINIINNGILFFPYSSYSLNIANDIKLVYKEIYNDLDFYMPLQKYKRVWFADMYAASISFYKYNLGTFGKHPFDYSAMPIIHYCHYKDKDKDNNLKWKKLKNIVLKKYNIIDEVSSR